MLGARYKTKKDLRASVGKPLRYIETSLFGPEFEADGQNTVVGPSPLLRKWYARVDCKNGLIVKVAAVLLAVTIAGCTTASPETSETKARWSNAGQGAAIGCIVTGPFCILGIGSLVGAIIGGNVSVEEKGVADAPVQ